VGQASGQGPVAVDFDAAASVDDDGVTTDADLDTDGASSDDDLDPPARGEESIDPKRADVRWGKRWAPERNTAELGVSGGATIFSEVHELYEVDTRLPRFGWRELARAAPTFALRAGYYPLRHFGMEGELTMAPVRVPEVDASAFGFSARAQLVGQIGLWSVTPFATLGAGTLGIRSGRGVLGNNRDGFLSVGGGLKFFLTRLIGLRLEYRNLFASELGPESTFGTSHQEILFGITFTLGRDKNEIEGPGIPTATDRDGDGWYDGEDECLVIPGLPEFRGCPAPDTDGDGVLDADDECPKQTGTEAYRGCPVPDTDGDGFDDDVDECPEEEGIAPDGCPIRDTDDDGILDDIDSCVDEPENFNNHEDEDGCPDELPEEVSRFTGKIEGIHFASNKADLKPDSKTVLDEAAAVLAKYGLRVEISGHTDDRGKESWNMELSQRRADAVRDYLGGAGVDASQLETIGWGPHKPIDSNKTKAGRLNNRRIEFRLLERDEQAITSYERDAEVERIQSVD
jgi:outer membrane protein OmpA-like peptidoglycan-associated protein